MSTKSAPPPPRVRTLLPYKFKNRAVTAILATVLAVIFLAACSTETTLSTEVPEATAEPTAVPTPTPVAYEDFANAVVPAADPERLAQLTKLLSLVPETYNAAVYLDLEFLRSNESLAALINPEVLGMDVALPSIATGLVNNIAVAVNLQTRGLITPFQNDFPIADMLRLASGFGLQLGGDGPQPYQGHDVWEINILGTALAMAAADESTGVAASGRGLTTMDARALTEASLDAFDGRSDSLLDAPGLTSLLGDVPSGFAAVALSRCEALPLFDGIPGLPGCTGVVVTADVLPGDLVVFHSLIGFAGQDDAASAMQRAAEALESEKQLQGFEDLGVRQEGDNLRVRVIVDVAKFADAFRLFAPGN
ncbi:MAG: hypothetical protein IIB89_11830 [Chloroflexi bacterium]|nr:hypothetical protein [Chloroflexota bacterium]